MVHRVVSYFGWIMVVQSFTPVASPARWPPLAIPRIGVKSKSTFSFVCVGWLLGHGLGTWISQHNAHRRKCSHAAWVSLSEGCDLFRPGDFSAIPTETPVFPHLFFLSPRSSLRHFLHVLSFSCSPVITVAFHRPCLCMPGKFVGIAIEIRRLDFLGLANILRLEIVKGVRRLDLLDLANGLRSIQHVPFKARVHSSFARLWRTAS